MKIVAAAFGPQDIEGGWVCPRKIKRLVSFYSYCCLSNSVQMELCPDGTLREELPGLNMTSRLLLSIMKQVLKALCFLDEQERVLLREAGAAASTSAFLLPLCSENFLLTKRNDLSFSLKLDFRQWLNSTESTNGQIKMKMATPRQLLHAAPELLDFHMCVPGPRMKKGVDGQTSRVWSFGILCLEMLMGETMLFQSEEVKLKSAIQNCDDKKTQQALSDSFMTISLNTTEFLKTASLAVVETVLQCLNLDAISRPIALHVLGRVKFYMRSRKDALRWGVPHENVFYRDARTLPQATFSRTKLHLANWTNSAVDSLVVLKEIPLPDQELENRGMVLRVQRQALLLLKLDNPHIVRYFDFRFDSVNPGGYSAQPSRCTLFLEYCAGGTLTTAAEGGRLPLHLIIKWSRQVVLGLQYLHEYDIHHLDIKCDNIFLSCPDQEACVMKIGDLDDMLCLQNIEYCGTLPSKSTLRYAPPEILENMTIMDASSADPIYIYDLQAVDIWCFGFVLSHMFMGQPLKYCAAGSTETFPSQYYGQINPAFVRHVKEKKLPELPKNLPDDALRLINECLAYDPNVRPTVDTILKAKFFQLQEISPDTDYSYELRPRWQRSENHFGGKSRPLLGSRPKPKPNT
ncbi:hypothetical protein RvY_16635-2 [Ramazzottius varieornatus]|nr:hypothetical protein RvY_16635-2 [Ramazzottius varieornatus]